MNTAKFIFTIRTIFIVLVLQILTMDVSHAAQLRFSFSDSAGDAFLFPGKTGSATDVVGLLFTFDNSTGAYTITMTATTANPFIGDVIINVNLFNPDTGTTEDAPSYFRDQLNRFSLSTPTTAITLTGANPTLRSWKTGDRVSACAGSGGIIPEDCAADLGHPDSTTDFQSGVINTHFDVPTGVPYPNIARDSFQEPPAATIAPAPEFTTKEYQDVTSIADLDGNGFPEIAVLHTWDGHAKVILKDSDDRALVSRIYFFNDKWIPKAIATLTDINGNATDELAVLAVKKENGSVIVKVVDSGTKEVLNRIYYLNNDWIAKGLTTVPDINNNGVGELAVVAVKKSTGNACTFIRDAETKEQFNWICY